MSQALNRAWTDIQGAAIIQAVTPGTLNCRTTLAGGTTVVQGLFLEMFLTSLCVPPLK
jgi:aquaporin related protein